MVGWLRGDREVRGEMEGQRVAGRAGTGNEGMERKGERFGWYSETFKNLILSCVVCIFIYK
jgi:hypothetical protein